MIRLAIAEDHQSLIDGIKLLLKYEEGISIIGTANDGEELVELVSLKRPSIVITDIRMPKLDGIAATKKIKKLFPEIKILAFTMFDQTDAIEQMIAAGASGYILKNSPLSEVLNAIKQVANGETYYDAHIDTNSLQTKASSSKKGVLTKRQIQILRLISQGKTSREIGEELFIGTLTVSTHRKNMIQILGLKGTGELMRYALEKKYEF
ncbi:response regulator transcription factor [Flavicella sediminum]|uniref:response regulator transcription factor n=1 Tax=Flavicella sediminum TaxID=2585141 RepID=UPI001121DB66|nr:response regulator transcription factor [Flavicella sediminum]